jgi:uncharacterized protein (TIGR01777 family)
LPGADQAAAGQAAAKGKVLIAGATGLIGSALVAALAEAGVAVAVLARNAGRAAELAPRAELHPWDATKGPAPEAAFRDVDVVVNLMGESISGRRWTDSQRKRIRDSRVVGTRALVDGIQGLARRPRVLISASGIGFYGDRKDVILTEASPPGTGFLAELARDWEAEAMRAVELGVRVVVLRNGVVLAREGGILGKLLTLFRMGLGGPFGGGRQWLPWIHIEDEVGLIRTLMGSTGQAGVGNSPDDVAASGPVNAVAPEPATNREFTSALGEALGRPAVLRTPAFALRLALGGARADELLLASQRAMPVRALEIGYAFRHPLLRGALKDLVSGRDDRATAAVGTS